MLPGLGLAFVSPNRSLQFDWVEFLKTLTVAYSLAHELHVVCLVTVTVTSPVQSEADQGELTLVPPPKEPDQILQPLSQPKTIR